MTELTRLKGVGKKTEELFARLGITSCEDLLHAYPVGYEAYGEPTGAGGVTVGAPCAVRARLTSRPSVFTTARRTTVTSLTIRDETGSLRITWFNMPYIRSQLTPGREVVFYGTVSRGKSGIVMDHPAVYTPEAYAEKIRTLVPRYALTKGLTNNAFSKAVREALSVVTGEAEYLPVSFLRLHGLMGEREAVREIHFPEDTERLTLARSRLAFDEFFQFILGLRLLKRQETELPSDAVMKPAWETELIMERLPYTLTVSQKRAWHEIEKDMCSGHRMTRLLQGDVGSGKTILAFLAMALCAENGAQCALMAPTEVLARQHYKNLKRLIDDGIITGVRPVLLTGSLKTAERREVEEAIRSGSANAVLGTHALFQEAVAYRNLALVITDEQHRFGVNQRRFFGEKGCDVHTLVMSATPIPRTMSVVFYGDMAVSILDDMPKARLPIKTCVVEDSYRPTAHAFIAREVRAGHQAYVVCPMIEASEEFEAQNVIDYAASLKKALPDCRIGILHGRQKPEEKEAVMQAFADNALSILVATTVVEVGVDVPNATVILIENAERFGLAQLHQLRGRVGRGSAQSYCIYMTGMSNETIRERLDILNRSRDGMTIAAHDLKLRGPGDLLGLRQSGEAAFRIADIFRDEAVMKAAAETAAAVIRDDPDLISPEYQDLRCRMERYLGEEKSLTL
ncbi:MAG: ATP-dependent DNA helicase RecG [Lachnospiraceae bacterium]|nr:ATP-dependent DNA helicase RecG [Lachnospiraceae bacterium]